MKFPLANHLPQLFFSIINLIYELLELIKAIGVADAKCPYSFEGAIKEVAFLEGEFTTRAGKKTNFYIDKYLFETQPKILEQVVDEIVSQLPPLDSFDRIAAPALGAVSLAAVLSLKIRPLY